jgi:hypothetical protein
VRQVTEWDLSGHRAEVPPAETERLREQIDVFPDPDSPWIRLRPAITSGAVDGLVRHRGAVRITTLDLRNNNLDNDAARALVKSPYLDNLKTLRLLDGNRLRGKVWQQVIERFGEDVVG